MTILATNLREAMPETETVDLRIGGMHCSACAVRIEKAVGRLPGVRQAAVSYASRSAWIVYEPSRLATANIQEAIRKLGFQASDERKPAFDEQEQRMLLLRFLLSALLTIPLLWPMAHHIELLSFVPVPSVLMNGWLQLALATVIQFVPAAPFYYGAYHALRQRSANMDVLVATGTTAAYLYSHYIVFRGGFAGMNASLYFETSSVVITAVLMGKWIEASAAVRTSAELNGFAALQPETAIVVRGDEQVAVPASSLQAEDQALVASGERYPADGILLSDAGEADESLLTGESRPTLKRRGDRVYAGTLNVGGSARFAVSAAGPSTAISRMNAMMREALASKTSVQRKADAIAGVFVPVMLLLAAAAFAVNYMLWTGDAETAFIRSLAVLLAACPCALGLATPLSLAAAASALAKRGIVMKQADALETLARLKAVVFDKTGTLTEGQASIAAVWSGALHPAALLRLAAAAEANAVHPFAAAVREAAALGASASTATVHGRHVQGSNASSVQGRQFDGGGRYELQGAAIERSGSRIAVGGLDYANMQQWAMNADVRAFAAEREQKGETIWYVAVDNSCVGAIALADSIREDAGRTVAALRKLGIHTVLASGDRQAPAGAAAAKARIHEVHASLRPEQKVKLIRSLQRQRGAVAMVGDGWNDAPALAAADVGFAIGGGTDAAMGAGQIALVRSRLHGVAEALTVSRYTMRNVRQNLALAFVYNAAVIPSAALGKLEPWMAGTAMALSSVSVVGNAIRLRLQLRSRMRPAKQLASR